MAAEVTISVALAAGSKLKFNSLDRFIEWFDDLSKNWSLLLDQSTQYPTAAVDGQEHIRSCNRQIRSQIDQLNAENAADTFRNFQFILTSHFPRGVLFAPGDVVLDGLRRLYPDVQTLAIAMACVVWAEARMTHQGAVSPAATAHPIAIEAIGFAAALRQVGHRNYAELLEAALTQHRSRVDENLSEFDALSNVALERLNTALDAKISEVDKQFLGLKSDGHDAIREIEATHDKFAELMRLKAPKDYWNDKASEHRANVGTYRIWLAVISSGTAALLLCTYGLGYFAMQSFATQHPAQAIAMTIYVAGFVGSVTAVGLWFIRIVVRLYMSQHHLATDAEERASFIHTYLALNEGGGVSEADRTLVLTSIFRPVPDGIVKDDGAPALTPGTFLASMLDRGKP